ncbi:MAG TPA: ABC transporter substrate-binding protein [Candidatus Methylomirabilis sp.]|nr:ABC transporter substrate-binding protein [Candidatus Methylomirabilis sp.]
MTRKLSASGFLGLLGFSTMVLAACGGDPHGPSVEVAAVWTGAEQKAFGDVLAAFERRAGARVTYTSTGDDIAAILGTRIHGGNPPDVAILPQPGLLADLARQDVLKPIQQVAGVEMDKNYAPIWRQLGSVNGILYGVWFKAANKSTVWYNVQVFRNAGVQPPANWAELLQAAKILSDYGVPPFSIAGADGWTLTDWFENVYLRTAGPVLYDRLTRHEIPWTDPSVGVALSTLAQILDREEWLAGGTDGALQTDFPTSVTQAFRPPPRAAMVYEGDFVAGVIAGETGARLGVVADFFHFPSIRGSPPSVVGGGDVAVLLRESEGGKALIRFLASPEAGEIWARLGGFTSPSRGVSLSAYPDDISRRSAEALLGAQVFRFDMSDQMPAAFGGTPGKGEWAILQDFLRRPSDVRGTMRRLEAAAKQAYRR